MAALKQSTVYTRMFLVVQTADHISGLTGASPTVNISKAGAAFGAAAGSITEVANGWYKIALTTADTGTLGDLAYHITAASGDPTDFVDQVTANILGDTLPVNLTQVNAHAVTDSSKRRARCQCQEYRWHGADWRRCWCRCGGDQSKDR